ncbi:MAG: tetratricopeptide repeat protein [Bacteroides sp.]|nr:tetratricopeptide repeat protein [Bacteroides sp.]
MKFKSFVSLAAALIIGGMGAINAQGYQDGVDNFNAGRLDVAKTILNNTLSDATTDKAVSYYYLGQIAFDEKDLATAEKYFTQGSQANATYAPNFIGLGQIALAKGDRKTAENYFKQASSFDKKDTEITAEIARAYWNVDPALYSKDIQKNIDKAFKDSKNTEAAVYVLQGDMAAKENPGEAASLYEMAITMDADKGHVNREAYVKYAQTYFRVNPRFAIQRLEELNEKEPNSALAQRELAEKYYDNDQFGSAYQTYKKYLENPNHFQNDEQRFAGLAFSAGEHEESLAMANKVLASDPDNYFMHRVIMMNHNKLENHAAAEEAGRKLFAVNGANLIPNDYILYADALSNQGKYDEAIEIYKQAIAANPDNAELLKSLSSVYDRAGQGDLAVSTMKQFLDAGNGTTTDLVNMARRYDNYARQLQKEYPDEPERSKEVAQEGLKYINQAIERVPDNATVYRIKGLLLLSAEGSNDNTASAFKKMLELLDADPENKTKQAGNYATAYYVLGNCAISAGDKPAAIDYFTKYIEIRPDEQVQATIDRLSK